VYLVTRFVGLIGRGLKHSISPQFQQAAFDHLGLDVRYELWDTEEGDLPEVLKGLRDPSKLGANVTIPHKERVMLLLDEVDPTAAGIGAVNTVVNKDGRLAGYNTDSTGFVTALRQEGAFDPVGKRAVLLGAGGVARAAGFALVGAGVASLVVTDVVAEKARGLVADLKRSSVQGNAPAPEIGALFQDGHEFAEAVSGCDLLVNCSPVGMRHSAGEEESPVRAGLIPRGALVYDLVYNPAETRLLKDAEEVGARALGGLAMLVYQGAAAFEMWTGQTAPVDIMMQAAKDALGQ
jgi:shikimate dehydrogenase